MGTDLSVPIRALVYCQYRVDGRIKKIDQRDRRSPELAL